MQNIIEEYLVKFGYTRDVLSEQNVQKSLDTVQKAVKDHVGDVGKYMLEWQGAITGAFLSAGAAAIGLVDHLANADLATKTLSARMMMSVKDTRAFAESLKLLNATPEDLMANPQLARYSQQLFVDQQAMAAKIGEGNIEGTLNQIEDVQQQFTRLHGIIDFLTMEVPLKLWEKLAPGHDLLADLTQFDNKLIGGIDKYSDRIAKFLLPLGHDVQDVFHDTTKAGEDLALMFTNIVGALTGDTDMEGTTFQWENFAKAIDKVATALTWFVHEMTEAEGLVSHSVNAGIFALQGNFHDAGSEAKAAGHDANPLTVGIDAALALSAAAAAVKIFSTAVSVATWPLKTLGLMGKGGAAAEGAEAAEGVEAASGVEGLLSAATIGSITAIALPIVVGALATYELFKHKDAAEAKGSSLLDEMGVPKHGLIGEHLDWWKHFTDEHPGIVTPSADSQQGGAPSDQAAHLKQIAQVIADRTGADPRLVFEDLMHESGGGTNRGARDLHNYSGIKNPGGQGYRDFTSDDQFADYYSNLLKKYYPGALTAKNEHDFANAFKHGTGGRSYMEDSEANYESGMERYKNQYLQSMGGGGSSSSVNIAAINVKVDGPITPEHVTEAVASGVKAGIKDHVDTSNSNLIMQTQGVFA